MGGGKEQSNNGNWCKCLFHLMVGLMDVPFNVKPNTGVMPEMGYPCQCGRMAEKGQ